jgi:hypothetical protein
LASVVAIGGLHGTVGGNFDSISIFLATPTLAADMPSRKAGLWEIRTSFGNSNFPGQVVQHASTLPPTK